MAPMNREAKVTVTVELAAWQHNMWTTTEGHWAKGFEMRMHNLYDAIAHEVAVQDPWGKELLHIQTGRPLT